MLARYNFAKGFKLVISTAIDFRLLPIFLYDSKGK